MFIFAFLPEIAAFLLFILVSIQDAGNGTLIVLMQMGLIGLLFIIRPSAFLGTLLKWWPLLLTPILATVSFVWSSVPDVSARYGAQFLFTAFVGVHLARMMTPKRFLTVLLFAVFVFCIMCILNGRTGPSAEGPVLIGLTGSKNQMSYEGQMLLMAGLSALLMGEISKPVRWLSLLAIPLAILILATTRSATGLLLAVAGCFALIALAFAQRVTPGGRLAAGIAVLAIIAPLTMLMPELQQAMDHFLYDTLNKDPTLTGRTILWEHADALIARRPVLGYGYQAIWMGDSFETIGLKRLTGIVDGRTFHFHNTFRQVGVDTGLIGMGVFIVTLIVVGLRGFWQLLVNPTPATSFFYAIFLLLLSRAFTDLIISPFSIHTILLYACGVYAFWKPENAAAQDQPFAWLNVRRPGPMPSMTR
ncbi:MAG: O-antigen ligase family protein [Vitreimonas sp.]